MSFEITIPVWFVDHWFLILASLWYLIAIPIVRRLIREGGPLNLGPEFICMVRLAMWIISPLALPVAFLFGNENNKGE